MIHAIMERIDTAWMMLSDRFDWFPKYPRP